MKDKISDIKKEEKAKVVELEHRKKSTVYNVTLIMGAWRKLFTLSIRNILISKALNKCIRKDGLIINGYWITDRKICLVIKCRKYSIKDTLEKFASRLNKEIKSYLKYISNPCCPIKKKKHRHKKHRWKPLFKVCPLTDANLIKLITGKKVKLPYYSPSLAMLVDMIDNYNYCSALDYTGAEGPVIIKLIKK